MCHLVAILMHLYRLFGQEQTLCLWHRLEQRKCIFAKEKRKQNHKQIHQKNKTTGKNQQQKQKGTRKHKKNACFPICVYCFPVFLLFFILVFKFCFVLFALVLLLKNHSHIPRAVGLITLRQNGIWTPQPFVCISSSASFPPSLHWSLLPSWGPSWDHFNSRFVTFRLSPPLQEQFTRINIHPRLTKFFQTMVGKL